MRGYVYQISVKPETAGERGLPKYPLEFASVTLQGIVGDFNRYRSEKKRNILSRALLLYPHETILQLHTEGWPVKPGDLGENITTIGIPYDSFGLGKRYKIGEVSLQIEEIATPCKVLYRLPYVGEEKGPAFLKTLVGRRGWYACVLQEGTLYNGDTIDEILKE